jgi:bifunctional NMN adenylyltransferase/nudix hydrolase
MNHIPADDYFDCLVFIGRFQPFHAGHLAVIKAGLERAALLIILCAAARQARSARNPWTERERDGMIRGSLTRSENNRVHVVPLPDDPYNDRAWSQRLEKQVSDLAVKLSGKPSALPRLGLIGPDVSSRADYARRWPRWQILDAPRLTGLSATLIRDQLFSAPDVDAARAYLRGSEAAGALPAHVIDTLVEFCGGADYARLKAEYDFIAEYRRAWSTTPFPPVFVTVDAVVTRGQEILLIRRDGQPGKGLWALPGGFVDETERLEDACVRELQEETNIDLPPEALRGAIKTRQVFDRPDRSAIGRVITHAFHFDLSAELPAPAVRGGDDAGQACWTPLVELDPAVLHEDHYFIIQRMLSLAAAGNSD